MQIFRDVASLQAFRASLRPETSIGLVATMGNLHEGHISLTRASVRDCDVTVVSIFVNPMQFAPLEDLSTYPRTLDGDIAACKAVGASALFVPPVDNVYPSSHCTQISTAVGDSARNARQEAADRPTMFRGVATVVVKLINAVRPTTVYFGQKDAQQVAVIYSLLRDLWLPCTLAVAPIVRQADGLALSSRNAYLSDSQRRRATLICAALQCGVRVFRGGERNVDRVRGAVLQHLADGGDGWGDELRVCYVGVCNRWSMLEVEGDGDIARDDAILLCTAVILGGVRLVDNVVLQEGIAPEGVRVIENSANEDVGVHIDKNIVKCGGPRGT